MTKKRYVLVKGMEVITDEDGDYTVMYIPGYALEHEQKRVGIFGYHWSEWKEGYHFMSLVAS